MTQPSYVRRYILVGLCNTAIDFGLFALLHESLGITFANFVSTSCGMTFSFLVNGRYTFGQQKQSLRDALVFVAATGTVLWVVQPLVIHGLVSAFGDQYVLAAKVVGAGVAVVGNFLGYRFLVWPNAARQRAGRDAAPEATRR